MDKKEENFLKRLQETFHHEAEEQVHGITSGQNISGSRKNFNKGEKNELFYEPLYAC